MFLMTTALCAKKKNNACRWYGGSRPIEELNKLNSLLVSYNAWVWLISGLSWLLAFTWHIFCLFIEKDKEKRNRKWPQPLILSSISGEQLMKTEVWPGEFLITIYQYLLTMEILICKNFFDILTPRRVVLAWQKEVGSYLLRYKFLILKRGTGLF